MKNCKEPGLDGMPVEFYKAYYFLGDLLVVLSSLSEERLPKRYMRGVLSLLPEKGDLKEVKNWRPVSLLCTDSVKNFGRKTEAGHPYRSVSLCTQQINSGLHIFDWKCSGNF